MHITVELATLKERLELVARISTKHLTLPALQCVLLSVSEQTLTLTATNLEVGIEATVPATQKEEGVVAVPASVLLQTITLLPHKSVVLRIEDGSLVVETDKSKTHINMVEVDDFPSIPKIETTKQGINGKTFAYGIKSAAFAASQSSIKPELGSVNITQKKEHTLTFVATDSFRLMEKTIAQQKLVLEEPLLIPQKNALELAHVCELREENPQLVVDENQCALIFSDVYITSRLTNGNFPDYEQIIPKEYTTHTTLLTKDLQSALKKTNIFLNKFMQLSVTVKPDSLVLTAHSGEVGTTTEEIPATTDGEELTLHFNQRYISEGLAHITDESAVLHFAGIGRPLVVAGVNDASVRYLVMPMNK